MCASVCECELGRFPGLGLVVCVLRVHTNSRADGISSGT